MKPEEIKEALEQYIALYGRDIFIADNINVADVLDLINRLEEENDSLKDTLQRECQAHNEYIFNTMAEIKRLKEAKNAYKDILDTCEIGAIKEFAEKIFAEVDYQSQCNLCEIQEAKLRHDITSVTRISFIETLNGRNYALCDIRRFIDNLLKEMGVE